jgi:hypothetical protein
MPDEELSVLRLLQKKHATSRNLLFASDDTSALQAAFDPKLQSVVPYTILLGPDGKVLYKNLGQSICWSYAERSSPPCLPTTLASINTGPRTDDGR